MGNGLHQTGAFLSRDPLGFVDGPNLYAYVNANPWSKFDPEGLWAEDAAIGVPSLAMGLKSLWDNMYRGSYGSAAIDVAGIIADGAAIATPGVPGGAGLGIKGSRAVVTVANKIDQAATITQGAAATVEAAQSGDAVGALSSGAQTALGAKSASPGGKSAKATREEAATASAARRTIHEHPDATTLSKEEMEYFQLNESNHRAYEHEFESGKGYIGEGVGGRPEMSAAERSSLHQDPLVRTDEYPVPTKLDARRYESQLMEDVDAVNNPNYYNLRPERDPLDK